MAHAIFMGTSAHEFEETTQRLALPKGDVGTGNGGR